MADFRERVALALDNFEEKIKESCNTAIAPDQRWRVPQLIETLSLIASRDFSPLNCAFRTASRETTLKELSEIATRASDLAKRLRDPKRSVGRAREQLAQRLKDMHETTIFALLDVPWFSGTGGRAPLNVAYIRCDLPHVLRGDSIGREQLAAQLDFLSDAAQTQFDFINDAVKKGKAPGTKDEGRWPDRRAQAAARILARFYYDATGLEPTISTIVGGPNEGQHYGPFLDLVSLVFEAMRIEREAFSYARHAADQLREQGQKSPP